MELYGVWCAGGSSAVMNSLTVGRSRLGVRARAWDRAASCVKAEGGRLIASCLSNSAGDSPVPGDRDRPIAIGCYVAADIVVRRRGEAASFSSLPSEFVAVLIRLSFPPTFPPFVICRSWRFPRGEFRGGGGRDPSSIKSFVAIHPIS